MIDQFIGATPGYVAIVVTHFTNGREPLQRSAPIIGWRLIDIDGGCNEHEIAPVFLGEQADHTSDHFKYYVGIAQPDGRVWWSGEMFTDQSTFIAAVFVAEAKRKAEQLARDQASSEYVEYATAWIDAVDDLDAGKARWQDEKRLRNLANVGADYREMLQERLYRKFPSHTLN